MASAPDPNDTGASLRLEGPVRGVLVVFEGIDGAGKTTLARQLGEKIEAYGRAVCFTREPTNGPLGQQIRAIAQQGRATISAAEEFRLFHQDREQHVQGVVRPALDAGQVVLQDRSYFSTVAYQGERGLDRAELLSASEKVAPRPDLLVWVDVPVATALDRIKRSRAGADDFETAANLSRVQQAFADLAAGLRRDGGRVLDLDGTQPTRALVDQVWSALEPLLKQ